MKIKNLVLAGAMTLSIAKSAEAQTVVYESENFRLKASAVVDSSLMSLCNAFNGYHYDTLFVGQLNDSVITHNVGEATIKTIYLDEKYLCDDVVVHEIGHANNEEEEYGNGVIKLSSGEIFTGTFGFSFVLRDSLNGDVFWDNSIEEGVMEFLTKEALGFGSDSMPICGKIELAESYIYWEKFIRQCVNLGFFSSEELFSWKEKGDLESFFSALYLDPEYEFSAAEIEYARDFFAKIGQGEDMWEELLWRRSRETVDCIVSMNGNF